MYIYLKTMLSYVCDINIYMCVNKEEPETQLI